MRLLLLLLLPSFALAQPVGPKAAEEVANAAAKAAYEVNEKHCAKAASLETTDATKALGEVVDVWQQISSAFDQTGRIHLLYWRGVIGSCIGQGERAYADLLGFTRSDTASQNFTSLVDDARRRLRVLRLQGVGQAVGRVLSPRRAGPPILQIGVGGSYQMAFEPPKPFHYGTCEADVSVRLVGPLRVMAFARPSVSGPNLTVEGTLPVEGRRSRSILVPFGVGPHLRFGSPTRFSPSLAVLGHFAVQPGPEGAVFLPGVALHAGVDAPFGDLPLALRPHVEVGNLGRLFVWRVGASLVSSI